MYSQAVSSAGRTNPYFNSHTHTNKAYASIIEDGSSQESTPTVLSVYSVGHVIPSKAQAKQSSELSAINRDLLACKSVKGD